MGHSPAHVHSRMDSGHRYITCKPETDVAVRVRRAVVVQVERTIVRVAARVRIERVTTVEVLVIAERPV